MADFSITVDIQAPPERVWAVMRDIERWLEWTASVTIIERLDSGPLAVGSRMRIRQPKFPVAVWQVTELEEGSGFTSVSRGPGVLVTAHHSIEPHEDSSRVTLSLRHSGLVGKLVARLTKGITERYLALEAQGLKARSEGGGIPRPHLPRKDAPGRQGAAC